MCLYPKYIDLPNKRPTMAQPYSRLHAVVPCGHCSECLKTRQANFATRIYLEAKRCKKMFFVTFTYNNEHLPLAMRVERVDKNTGSIEDVSPFKILDNDVAANFRSEICSQRATSEARYVYRDVCDFSGYYWRASITPSLNRKDVRNWLKKSRIQFEREFGYKLDFVYAFCGEYGPRGGRPHYHALFMDIEKDELDWILKKWSDVYGYTYTKEIPQFNPDGTDARLIVAKYVGKYIAKGKFDIDSCKRGDCEKGRLCNSLNLGSHLTNEEIAYYRCYDLFGEYDLDTLVIYNSSDCSVGQRLSDSQVVTLCAEIEKRSKISLGLDSNGKSIERALPMYLKKKLFCIKDVYYDKVDSKNKVRYVGSVISSKVAAFKRGEFIKRHVCEFRQIRPSIDVSDVSLETYFEILCWSKGFDVDGKEAQNAFDIQAEYFRREKDCQ